MQIINGTPEDIDMVFSLYDEAVIYQKTKFNKHWMGFERSLVEKEIKEKRLWKIMEKDSVACIFSIVYDDPVIWKEKNDEPSIYIHRIVTNPLFKGNAYVKDIIVWAREHGKLTNKHF